MRGGQSMKAFQNSELSGKTGEDSEPESSEEESSEERGSEELDGSSV